jgi:predicted nucleic acid-binding protein
MIVIDASVTSKLYLPHEEGYEKVKTIFAQHVANEERIVVPDLLFYEVANTLTTKSNIPLEQTVASLENLYLFKLVIVALSTKEMVATMKFAKNYHVSVYDASYAVLAEEKKCDLITADAKFVKQVNLPYIQLLK